MTLADSNVWLALVLSGHEHHSAVSSWFAGQVEGEVVFCRSTQISVMRLLTTRAVLSPFGNPPLSNEQAWELYEGLFADSRIGFVGEPPGLEVYWKRMACVPSASPKLWMDAYLAAFAIAGGHRLVTTDAAFGQFSGLEVIVLPGG